MSPHAKRVTLKGTRPVSPEYNNVQLVPRVSAEPVSFEPSNVIVSGSRAG